MQKVNSSGRTDRRSLAIIALCSCSPSVSSYKFLCNLIMREKICLMVIKMTFIESRVIRTMRSNLTGASDALNCWETQVLINKIETAPSWAWIVRIGIVSRQQHYFQPSWHCLKCRCRVLWVMFAISNRLPAILC